eukprot:GDKJ01014837.1.p2 GENE.GDKJ01014837.1~~GDKJ01014837.1.p2  ORF type:complete len:166 (+),score=1.12 GDKJ01014837.1:116-613(+)
MNKLLEGSAWRGSTSSPSRWVVKKAWESSVLASGRSRASIVKHCEKKSMKSGSEAAGQSSGRDGGDAQDAILNISWPGSRSSCSQSQSHGYPPEAISSRVQPKLHISEASEGREYLQTSGAMNRGVPMRRVFLLCDASEMTAFPRSPSLIVRLAPSNIFEDLISW